MPDHRGLTELLQKAREGQAGALDQVMEVVYADLRRLASKHMQRHFGPGLTGVTLQPTALVNETFLRIIKQRKAFDSRGQFFAIATRLMLRVLMDYHRARGAEKRGGGQLRVSLHDVLAPEAGAEVPALIEALDKLERLDARKAEVVKLRVIWGLTVPEVAQATGVSPPTVERDWRFAKSWLARALDRGQ